jgi:hypothetical protein
MRRSATLQKSSAYRRVLDLDELDLPHALKVSPV